MAWSNRYCCSSSRSLHSEIRSREINGFRVRKRPYVQGGESDSGGRGAGILAIDHDDAPSPPLALSFGKTLRSGHLLAVADEDGFIALYDTRRPLPSSRFPIEQPVEAKVSEWSAHSNAVFNTCWAKEDSVLMTASGDQTIRAWNVETTQLLDVMWGHSGSIKTLCSHPLNPDLLVSGSRDGCVALWDRRCNSISRKVLGKPCLMPIAVIHNAHPPKDYHTRPTVMFNNPNTCTKRKSSKQAKTASKSITSVLYLKDGLSIASGGAVDSVIKFWDSRNLKTNTAQAQPHIETYSVKKKGAHGVTCLSQVLDGSSLAASCMDSRIYLYNVLQPDKGPVKTFSGHLIESFYVKSAISHDGAHLLSGSTDGHAYVWQVDEPEAAPVMLEGHEAEVTAVDWCPSEIGKIATAADDYTVRIWRSKTGSYLNHKSASVTRTEATCSSLEYGQLCGDVPSTEQTESPQTSPAHCSPPDSTNLQALTPEATVKMSSFQSFMEEARLQKTSEDNMTSPSSVLNPPSSLKRRRTIRDYFVAAS
ncbi:uncharacterized protein LOC116249011 [Nymphaea colorata]|nr:uncharacterized protein LOC116249011 [Nymphaea colorata]